MDSRRMSTLSHNSLSGETKIFRHDRRNSVIHTLATSRPSLRGDEKIGVGGKRGSILSGGQLVSAKRREVSKINRSGCFGWCDAKIENFYFSKLLLTKIIQKSWKIKKLNIHAMHSMIYYNYTGQCIRDSKELLFFSEELLFEIWIWYNRWLLFSIVNQMEIKILNF